MKRLRLLSLIILLCAVGLVTYIQVVKGNATDGIAPAITMDKTAITVSVEDDESVLLEGITAQDNRDGDVTDSLTIDNISAFNKDGKRYVTVAAFDNNNNVGKATREITYTDYRPPHFDITEPMTFALGSTKYFENITANDVLDGDVTGNIHFEDNTRFYSNEAGDYDVTIQVKNSAGDVGSLPLTISIMEKTYDEKPRVKLKHYVRYAKKGSKPLDYRKNMESVFIGSKEYELVDGEEITEETVGRDRIRISDKAVDYKTTGIYEVTYKLTIVTGQGEDEERITGTTKLIVVVED